MIKKPSCNFFLKGWKKSFLEIKAITNFQLQSRLQIQLIRNNSLITSSNKISHYIDCSRKAVNQPLYCNNETYLKEKRKSFHLTNFVKFVQCVVRYVWMCNSVCVSLSVSINSCKSWPFLLLGMIMTPRKQRYFLHLLINYIL